jgi:hypothetical protein
VPLCLFEGPFAYYLFIASGFLLLPFSKLDAVAVTELQGVGGEKKVESLKPGLDGAWLGSFYVITDVIDESYSNAPCIRPGAARLVIGRARLVGSPQKRFFHDPQRDSARAAVAATRGLQSTRQASLYTLRSGLCFLLSGCAKSETFCPTIGIG